MKPNKPTGTIRLRTLQWPDDRGYAYLTSWLYGTLALCVRWGRSSGFAAADIPSYPKGHRAGRIWIEDARHPATHLQDYVRFPVKGK